MPDGCYCWECGCVAEWCTCDEEAARERRAHLARQVNIYAQGIEARSAMTEGHGPKDESPVTK